MKKLAYWNDYYQDEEDLKANNIFSVEEVYLNKKRIVIPDNELRFWLSIRWKLEDI